LEDDGEKHPGPVERGEPIAQIYPYPLDSLDEVEPEILMLQENPELF